MIKAEIIADSRNEFGNRLTTMVVTFPRYILAEFNTHRMLSKNSASSRAIPFNKLIESVKNSPFIPMAWQKNHTGMQGTEYCTIREHEVLDSAWLIARNKAIEQALYMASYCNPTKQLINRLLEPYMYHTCIVSGTEWENFFALRCPQYTFNVTNTDNDGVKAFRSKKDAIKLLPSLINSSKEEWLLYNKGMADIHMMALAEAMWDAYNESTPKQLQAGEWHIPYEEKIESLFNIIQSPIDRGMYIPDSVKVSTMMCARVSYTTIGEEGGEWTLDKYLQKHDSLVNQKPLHASPLEHCSQCMNTDEFVSGVHGDLKTSAFYTAQEVIENEGCLIEKNIEFAHLGWSGNFRGFTQYRKMIPNENITK